MSKYNKRDLLKQIKTNVCCARKGCKKRLTEFQLKNGSIYCSISCSLKVRAIKQKPLIEKKKKEKEKEKLKLKKIKLDEKNKNKKIKSKLNSSKKQGRKRISEDGKGNKRYYCKNCHKRFRSAKPRKYCSDECNSRSYFIDKIKDMSYNNAFILGYLWNSSFIYNSNCIKIYNSKDILEELSKLMNSTYPIKKSSVNYHILVYDIDLVNSLFKYGMYYKYWMYYDIPLIPEKYWDRFMDGLLRSGTKSCDENRIYVRMVNKEVCRFYCMYRGNDMIWYKGGWNIIINHNLKNTINYEDIWNKMILYNLK